MSYSHEGARPHRTGVYIPHISPIRSSFTNERSVYDPSRVVGRGASAYQLSNTSVEDDIQFSDSVSAKRSASPVTSIISEDLSLVCDYPNPPSATHASRTTRKDSLARSYTQEWSSGEESYGDANETSPYDTRQNQSPPQFSSPTSGQTNSNVSEPASGMTVILEEGPTYLNGRYASNRPKYDSRRGQSQDDVRHPDIGHRTTPHRRVHSVQQHIPRETWEAPLRRSSNPPQPSRRDKYAIKFRSEEASRHIQLLEKGYNHFLDVATGSNEYVFSSLRAVVEMSLKMNLQLQQLAGQEDLNPMTKASVTNVLLGCDDQIRSLTEYLLESSAPAPIGKDKDESAPSTAYSSARSSRPTAYRHVADIFPSTPSSNVGYSTPRLSRPPTSSFYRNYDHPDPPISPQLSVDSLPPPERVYRHHPSASAHYYRGGMPMVDALSERRIYVDPRQPSSAGLHSRKYSTLTSDMHTYSQRYHPAPQPFPSRNDYLDRFSGLERPYQSYR